jgi:exodeoxyribonuclease VII large subunit
MSLPNHISLHELTQKIQQSLQSNMSNSYWITAEISEFSVNSKGHCYLELIEKPETSEHIIAKQRAIIWAQKYGMISAYFKSVTGENMQIGLSILCCVKVDFHEIYGLSLTIIDIEPVYTIGEDERQRIQIVARLESEGILTMNQEVPLAEVVQKIAVISSPHAAGYQDFIKQLQANEYGIAFYTALFPASMQGLEVESSIIAALDKIFESEELFDAVVIIRGGGSKSDLRWFDSYRLAAHIAQFPLPIITGIGHHKDVSIADMVAHISLKTPTAVADFFIQLGVAVLQRVSELEYKIQERVRALFAEYNEKHVDLYRTIYSEYQQKTLGIHHQIIQNTQRLLSQTQQIMAAEHQKNAQYVYKIRMGVQQIFQNHASQMQQLNKTCTFMSKSYITKEISKLELYATKLELHNPIHVLEQGYSYTKTAHGKPVRSALELTSGQKITTVFKDGNVASIVE